MANSVVLAAIVGKKQDAQAELRSQLEAADSGHPMLTDLQEKSQLFDTAAKKYSAKVSS